MDIERLKIIKHELIAMEEGVKFHGEKGKQYWRKWLIDNAWFFEAVIELVDAEIARQSVTDEAVQDAISWLESDKIDRQREWEKQDTEWKLEPGAKEMHDSFMSAFDLAIQTLRQMKSSE